MNRQTRVIMISLLVGTFGGALMFVPLRSAGSDQIVSPSPQVTTFRLASRELAQEELIDHQQDIASPRDPETPQQISSEAYKPSLATKLPKQKEPDVQAFSPLFQDHGEPLMHDDDPTEELPHDGETFYDLIHVTIPPQFDRSLFTSAVVYPEVAKRRGIEGRVMLRLFIDAQGVLQKIIVEEDPGYGFAESAVRAFTGLSFKPASIDGRTVAVTIQYPVVFALGR